MNNPSIFIGDDESFAMKNYNFYQDFPKLFFIDLHMLWVFDLHYDVCNLTAVRNFAFKLLPAIIFYNSRVTRESLPPPVPVQRNRHLLIKIYFKSINFMSEIQKVSFLRCRILGFHWQYLLSMSNLIIFNNSKDDIWIKNFLSYDFCNIVPTKMQN